MQKEYFLGLDIGSNSVGYAITDKNYNIIKFKNKAMWGSHMFEEGKQCDERGTFRSARRRLERKKQRTQFTREIFAKEIAKFDEDFFIRLDESALLHEDKSHGSKHSIFDDANMKDKDYHKRYPTIHHLIMDLIKTKEKKDIRLIYLAVNYMLTHRGHFHADVDKEDIKKVISFDAVFNEFIGYFEENEIESNWCDSVKDELGRVLKVKAGLREKQTKIKEIVFGKKKPDKSNDTIVKALSGSKFKLSDIFVKTEYNDLEVNNISLSDSDFDKTMIELGIYLEESEMDLIIKMKSVYDWSLLSDILMGNEFISEGKVKLYEQHKTDLDILKGLVKRYLPRKYNEVFKYSKKDLDNYVAYSGNFKSASNKDIGVENKKEEIIAFYKTDNEKFCKYIKKLLEGISITTEAEKDKEDFESIKSRIDLRNAFMPKQVSTDNSVIPYQLIRYQLKNLLLNAAKYHHFLLEKDEANVNAVDKLLSIIEFRIPYYVGPLNKYHGKYAWLERKADGKIFPWNFEEKVDLEKSEKAFIRRMTRKCIYLAGEEVLCKNSLLYSKFMVLNEINNIKINENAISVECKQKLYKELFERNKSRITKKKIENWLLCNNYMELNQEIKGIDEEIKSSLRPYFDFKRLLTLNILNEKQIEIIIERLSFTDDKKRMKSYLKKEFPKLPDEDLNYISNLKYKDYGRLSKRLLTEIITFIPQSGEETNIINALWNTNYNLMQLLSQEFGFKKYIDEHNDAYYKENPKSINEILEDMYISNAVKRPIYRTLAIVKEIKGVMKKGPKKIFIEMARSEEEKKKTKTRKTQLMELYKSLDYEYREKWIEKLEKEPEDILKSDRFFLYYTQLGRCMYTSNEINFEQLLDRTYDVDHIYPQSRIKDDSVHNNKALVESSYNQNKKDEYPLPKEYQKKMAGFWSMLLNKGLINKEKFYRLTRTTNFKDEELAGFINRQLVETRQSTKAVARLLENIFPDTEIVYVKAGLISEFRQQFGLPKSRIINDLHHAKDAYLNIVIGNVYNVKFTKNPLNFIKTKEKYSINIKEKGGLLSRDIKRNDEVAWRGDGSTISLVKNTMNKNNVNYTRYAFCRRGGFFNQNPDKAPLEKSELVSRKKNLPANVYGGYNDTKASFFTLIKYTEKGKDVIAIKPVELLYEERYLNDEGFALDYCRTRLGLENPLIISNKRMIKINTVLSIGGFKASIASKSNAGATIVLSSNIPFILGMNQETYIKKLESAIRKISEAKKNKSNYKIKEKFDRISKRENEVLYAEIKEKCKKNIYSNLSVFNSLLETLQKGEDIFKALSIEEQVETLNSIIGVFKTGRTTGCNLTKIGGPKAAAVITLNAKISATKYNSIEIIDQSATGLFEKKSGNLLEL